MTDLCVTVAYFMLVFFAGALVGVGVLKLLDSLKDHFDETQP